MAEQSFELTTLGELRLRGPSGTVLTGRRKELALLAYLARRAPKSVPRDELTALLWGERDEEKARQSLRQALHQLRQTLGSSIEVTPDQVTIAPTTLSVDATDLERDVNAGRLADAVARWNGDFLHGIEDVGADGFRAWLEQEREALRRTVGTALSGLVTSARSDGDLLREVEWAQRWASIFPLDETAHRHLIDALRRSGDGKLARSILESFRSRLQRELDESPSIELIRLGELLDRESDSERKRTAGSGAVHAPALVGRGATSAAALYELWSRNRAEGSFVVIEGEPGTGKSRLCAELARRASGGQGASLVLQASGRPGDDEYATFRRLMTGLVAAQVLDDAPAKALTGLSSVLPAVRERYPQLGTPNVSAERIEAAVGDVLRSIGGRTSVLMVLDDAGMADAASLRLVRALIAAPPRGTMIVFTLRSDAQADAALARELGELPRAKRFKLAALTRDEVSQLIDSMIDVSTAARAPLVERVLEQTGGNPKAVTAVVSAMTGSGALTLNAGGVWEPGPSFGPAPSPSRASEPLRTAPVTRARQFVVAGIVLAFIAAVPLARQALTRQRITSVAAPRIAVLDLDHVTQDTSDAYLATGLAEEINASLSRIEGLRLKSRGVIRAAAAKGDADPVQLGRTLQVDYLVEGALRRVGGQVRVSIHLTKAADGFQVWNDDFNVDAALPRLHERIAREVAERVGLSVAGVSTVRRPLTDDADAYEHYLRGNYLLARRTPPATQQAIAQYREAVARDSTFAAAWARIAYSYSLMLDWGWAFEGKPSDQLLREGVAYSHRALELDSLSADAWMAKAYVLVASDPVRMRGAVDAFERAIALDPRNAEALHQYAQVHEALGNWEAAMSAFRRTLLLEGDRSLPYVAMASIAWKQEKPELARQLYDSALAVDPGAAYVLSARALLRLHSLHDSVGALQDAETAVRVNEGYEIPPRSVLASALVHTGSRARAELEVQRAQQAIADPSAPSPTDARWLSSALLSLGRREEALNLLERARPRGAWLWFYTLSHDFDVIRTEPRFVRIMAEAHPPDVQALEKR